MIKWEGYKNSKKTKSILSILNEANETLIKENRYYISVISVILLLVKILHNVVMRKEMKA